MTSDHSSFSDDVSTSLANGAARGSIDPTADDSTPATVAPGITAPATTAPGTVVSTADVSLVSAPASAVPDGGVLSQAFGYIARAKALMIDAIPDGATDKWVVAHYHELVPLLASNVSSMLTVAALHGAMSLPKHAYFGNDPVAWLAQAAKLSLKDANQLRACAALLYTPKTLILPPTQASLSPRRKTLIQQEHQSRLRARLTELDISLQSLIALCVTSDRLAISCKHRRVEVITSTLDAAQVLTPDEVKRLAARQVRRINAEEKASAASLRQPSLVYQHPDEFGYVTSYSYAPKDKQNQQEALLTDCQRTIRRLFREAGLSDPYRGRNKSSQRWLTHHWVLALGHGALHQGLATIHADGTIGIDDTATSPRAGQGADPDQGGGGDKDGAGSGDSLAPRASLVAYARIEDLISPRRNDSTVRTNDGNVIALSDALVLAGYGIDHFAVVGGDNRGAIFDIQTDSDGRMQPRSVTTSEQVVPRRFASRAQRLLLGFIQPYCAHPGCVVPAIKCQAHHLRAHKDGGETSIRNMALLCAYHHSKTDDSREKEHQGHYDKDTNGVVFWQPHGDRATVGSPPAQYNTRNQPTQRKNKYDNRDYDRSGDRKGGRSRKEPDETDSRDGRINPQTTGQ